MPEYAFYIAQNAIFLKWNLQILSKYIFDMKLKISLISQRVLFMVSFARLLAIKNYCHTISYSEVHNCKARAWYVYTIVLVYTYQNIKIKSDPLICVMYDLTFNVRHPLFDSGVNRVEDFRRMYKSQCG